MKSWTKAAFIVLLFAAPVANAAWHGGKIQALNIAYDGSTIAFALVGYSRSDCTCYPTWSNSLCLNRARASFKEEMAMLLSARARGTEIHVNINETTCFVEAMYEAE
jgi:hypothetical protein